ncbi:hypothetical protein HDU87_002374 [Geranomyces variabilis]|uniref:Uncharacterized protein n=1 Tax=Geranomyces variabilis TaxID=109894 RepID=A0AAD5TL14_9FUNG|nr:hypothetical protein HDU87_002374 [Geranomyces variabilis]
MLRTPPGIPNDRAGRRLAVPAIVQPALLRNANPILAIGEAKFQWRSPYASESSLLLQLFKLSISSITLMGTLFVMNLDVFSTANIAFGVRTIGLLDGK